MSLIIRVKDANYKAKRTGFYPNVTDGLKCWFFGGGSLSESSQNYLNGGSQGSATAGQVNTYDLTNGASIISAVPNDFWNTSKGASFVILGSPAKGNNLSDGSSWKTTPVGSSSYSNALIRSRLFNGLEYDWMMSAFSYVNPTDTRTDLNSMVLVDGSPSWQASQINFICGTIDASNMASVKVRTYLRNSNGLLADQTVTGDWTGRNLDFRNLGVYNLSGPDVGGNVTTAPKLHAGAVYGKALSTVEIEKLYAYFKGYYDRRGVTGL